ncbi:MAG: DJ-1/PfpI family protein, partial [Algicola sp.]|nr:DJ-1/PfpI family protein [Algicola sp.]
MTDKKVINVVILASQNAILSTIASPMDMFLQAGVLWNITMGEKPSPLFDVKIVTADGCPITALNNFPVIPSCAMDDIEHLDLIVIPSQGFLFNPDDKHHIARIKWLQSWYERGADLASVCGGAFTLADTGLLDGKTATTHWGLAKQFNSRYP